jgi:hypothetical protein
VDRAAVVPGPTAVEVGEDLQEAPGRQNDVIVEHGGTGEVDLGQQRHRDAVPVRP